MEEKQIFDSVIEMLKPYVKKPEGLNNVSTSTDILRDLGVNSARLVDIVLAFEDKFDITIDDSEADKVATVGDAVSMISSKVA